MRSAEAADDDEDPTEGSCRCCCCWAQAGQVSALLFTRVRNFRITGVCLLEERVAGSPSPGPSLLPWRDKEAGVS
jgi:hypothetical protein